MKPTPAQRAMAIHNREILAERCGWPAGTLAECVALEQRFPDWDVFWLPENTIRGFERVAGFSAVRQGYHTVTLDDPDPVALAERMEQTPPERCFDLDEDCLLCIAEVEARVNRTSIEMELRRKKRGQG